MKLDGTYNTWLVGTDCKNDDGIIRQDLIRTLIQRGELMDGTGLFLFPQPSNREDPNCILIQTRKGLTIGRLPSEFAAFVASEIKQGYGFKAYIDSRIGATGFTGGIKLCVERYRKGDDVSSARKNGRETNESPRCPDGRFFVKIAYEEMGEEKIDYLFKSRNYVQSGMIVVGTQVNFEQVIRKDNGSPFISVVLFNGQRIGYLSAEWSERVSNWLKQDYVLKASISSVADLSHIGLLLEITIMIEKYMTSKIISEITAKHDVQLLGDEYYDFNRDRTYWN